MLGSPAAITYQRRRPEGSVLHAVVRAHLGPFLDRTEDAGVQLPRFVVRQLRRYLGCGILAHGFARGVCRDCRAPRLIAFSCKGRTACPSCGARRMAATAAHLMDRVLPSVRMRQWVLSMPFVLRWPLATDPKFLSAVLRIFLDEVFGHYTGRHVKAALRRKSCGAVAFIHRFDASLNLNVHFHALVIDGRYRLVDDALQFEATAAPSQAKLQKLSARVARRVHRLALRRGILDDTGAPLWGDPLPTGSPAEGWAFGWLQADGQPIAATGSMSSGSTGRARSAEVAGFSIHAGTVSEARDEEARERLCRYVARPPLADAQLSWTNDGRVALRLSRPRKNGATHAFMSPMSLLRRITTLIPRAGQNLIRYAGLLAANARRRAQVVPRPADNLELPTPTQAPPPGPRHPRATDIDWASLLSRVYDIDALACPCGGRIRIIALIDDPLVASKILDHLGLATDLADAPARAPP